MNGYESPFQLPEDQKCTAPSEEWHEWARWRNEYAKPDATDQSREFALNSMLRYVTESNPPDVKQKTHRVQRRPSDRKLVAVSVISVILAVCMLTCFLAILL